MSRQRRHEPQWSRSGRSTGNSAVVKIAPRKSQFPKSRETSTVCLPCQPSPAASASGFSMTGAVSTNTFTSELAFDDIVIVAVAGVDREVRPVLARERRERIALRPVVEPEQDDASGLRPQ